MGRPVRFPRAPPGHGEGPWKCQGSDRGMSDFVDFWLLAGSGALAVTTLVGGIRRPRSMCMLERLGALKRAGAVGQDGRAGAA